MDPHSSVSIADDLSFSTKGSGADVTMGKGVIRHQRTCNLTGRIPSLLPLQFYAGLAAVPHPVACCCSIGARDS